MGAGKTVKQRFCSSRVGIWTIAITPLLLVGVWAQTARAQQEPQLRPSLDDYYNRTFYRNDPDFFANRSIFRTINLLVGPFPENEISADGRAVHRLYQETMRLQDSSDPDIRTADLPNPFNTSIATAPIVGPEAPIPPAPATPFQRQFAPSAAPAPAPVQRQPRGLW